MTAAAATNLDRALVKMMMIGAVAISHVHESVRMMTIGAVAANRVLVVVAANHDQNHALAVAALSQSRVLVVAAPNQSRAHDAVVPNQNHVHDAAAVSLVQNRVLVHSTKKT